MHAGGCPRRREGGAARSAGLRLESRDDRPPPHHDRRRGARRDLHRRQAQAGGDRGLRPARRSPPPGRHLGEEPLPGPVVRRAVARLLVLLRAAKVDWSRPFATQPEILEYMAHVVEKYDLAPHIRYGTEIREARSDDARRPGASRRATAGPPPRTSSSPRWACSTSCAGRTSGVLDDFAGPTVHSGAWPESGLDLRGKAVAVIGSAAAAVQMIPEIAAQAAQLDVVPSARRTGCSPRTTRRSRRGDRRSGSPIRRSPSGCAMRRWTSSSAAHVRGPRPHRRPRGQGRGEPRAGKRPRAPRRADTADRFLFGV